MCRTYASPMTSPSNDPRAPFSMPDPSGYSAPSGPQHLPMPYGQVPPPQPMHPQSPGTGYPSPSYSNPAYPNPTYSNPTYSHPVPVNYIQPVLAGPPVVVVTAPKSVGLAFLLTFLFGPLGMLYSTVTGALIMLGISFVAAFVSLVTFGIPLFFCWVASIVWGCVAASSHNARMVQPRYY